MIRKRRGEMDMHHIKSGLLAVVLFFMAVFLPVHAKGEQVIGTAVYDGNIYIYVRGITEPGPDSRVQIGNTVCSSEQLSVASVSDLGMALRTIVLVDNSKSIPDKNHGDIQEILKNITGNSSGCEQFKIGTFSDEVVWLCDYTIEPELLSNVVETIEYKDQDSYLSDVLYDVMAELKQEATSACTRILIISDGADDNSLGYTNDEVRGLMGENGYQVYSVGIPGKNNTSELETMFSFSRASGSGYFLLDGSISNEEIANELLRDQNGICIRVALKEELKDGSTKNILVRLGTEEGIIELTTRADMPFGNGVEPEDEVMEETAEEPEEEQEEEIPVLSVSSEVKEEEPDGGKESFPWLMVILAVAMALLSAALAYLVFLQKKKSLEKTKEEHTEDSTVSQQAQRKKSEEDENLTVIDSGGQGNYGQVKKLWIQYYLILKNLDRPQMLYKVPIVDVIHIGRQDTDIVLDDPKVSRKHCDIILRGDLLYIKDCNSKNHTYYENVIVHEEAPVISGGKLKIGEYTYQVELTKG